MTVCVRIVLLTSRTNSQICREFPPYTSASLFRPDTRGSPANTEGRTSSRSQRSGNSKSPSQYATFHHSGRLSHQFFQALVRDNYCRLVSGSFDMYIYARPPETVARAASRSIIVRPTYATHIFPASPSEGVAGADVGDSKVS